MVRLLGSAIILIFKKEVFHCDKTTGRGKAAVPGIKHHICTGGYQSISSTTGREIRHYCSISDYQNLCL
jgi:hypothetical protein